MQILDYTNSQVVTLDAGQVKLQTGTFKLIHIIDTDRYQEIIDTIKVKVDEDVNGAHYLRPFITYELLELQGYLDRLKPKTKRSLNFIGTAWKWIAGNPDHDDFEIIKMKTDEMLANNNKQVVINKLSLEKINELIGTTNEILKNVNYNETMRDRMIHGLKLKIDMLKTEIVNIQYAIHWAKVGVVNTFILSSDEINIVKEIINQDLIPFVNIEQVFEFAEVKIASNKNSIVYIISIPTTDTNSCNKLLVKPVKFGKFVDKIEFQNVITCNETTYGIRTNCKTYNNITICKRTQLKNIDNDRCLANLIKSKSSNCSVIDNRHIPTIEEITPGVILLNQFNETVYINNEPQQLSGTYILQFHNTSIRILDKSYNFFKTSHLQPLPAILQPRLTDPNIEETLSLELVKELQVNNTEAIDQLTSRNKWGLTINVGFTSIAITLVVCLLLKNKPFAKKKTLIISSPVISTGTAMHTSMPDLSETNTRKSPGVTRISSIPYF